ncbi:MAG: cation-translocating P-type ATPase [Ignavibacteriales bacterium]|nr:cation-translocating P-type ATPase [Ignavibacteriales bacterium]
MIIFLATLAGLPAPLTAIQLLWLNLITDGAPALALAMEKGDPDIMDQQAARQSTSRSSTAPWRLGIVIQTIAQTGAVLTRLRSGSALAPRSRRRHPGRREPARLPARSTTGAAWMCRPPRRWPSSPCRCASCSAPTPSARSALRSSRIGVFSNKYMQYAVGLSIALLLLVCHRALPAADLQYALPQPARVERGPGSGDHACQLQKRSRSSSCA